MKWKGKRVLVTGAGGFIGSHLTEALVNSGARVRAFIKYNSRGDLGNIELLSREVAAKIEIRPGDLRDMPSVYNAVKGCDIVFHLGALIAIPYSYVNPFDFVQTNVNGTANVLNACLNYGVKRLVHTSTSEVYGTARYVPIDEEHPLCGQSPYSASKIGADKMAESYFRSFGLPVVTIRPFNTYGPRQTARAVIPTIISQMIKRGACIDLGSVSTTRDFNYVEDIVRAFMAAGACSDKCEGEVINIGSRTEVSIKQVVDKVARILGVRCKVSAKRERIRPEASEVRRLVADNRKAKRLLGWRPRVDIDEGLERTVEWIREHSSRYKTEVYNI